MKYKKEWIAALRSGKYKQGRYYLNSDGCHCCLGVLCEVAIQNGEEIYSENDLEPKAFSRLGEEDVDESALTDGICELLEFPVFLHGVLVDMNDTELRSFDDIADYLEKSNEL